MINSFQQNRIKQIIAFVVLGALYNVSNTYFTVRLAKGRDRRPPIDYMHELMLRFFFYLENNKN